MADTALLSGDARLLTLKIAAPGVTAMLASSACQLFEALVLAQNDTPLSAAVGACLALILLEQTVGFTLGMGAAVLSAAASAKAASGIRPPPRANPIAKRPGVRPGRRSFPPCCSPVCC